MGNSLLAVRGINHKYIVVERRKYMFTELNGKELMETDGGFPWTPVIVIGIIVSGCLASCSNSCDK